MKKIKKALNKIKSRKLSHSNNGVVGIVVAVLLIGLIVSVISIIQAAYIPKWMEEKEAEHIEQVLVQFSELKLAIDTNLANKEENTPIATSITLGSKEFPFLMSAKAYGSLEIIDNTSNDACKINISYYNATGQYYSEYKLGLIKYTSHNAYYIPDQKQSFIYEAGAVITSQTSGNSISIKPSFKPIDNPTTNDSIIFKIVNIIGIGGKTSYGGYDTVPILTEYKYNSSDNIDNVKSIIISTSYPNAWKTFLDSSFKKEGITEYNCSVGINEVIVKFDPEDSYPNLKISLIGINAQIGPGWVE